ncbi:MAG: FTR1 family protein [Vallitaleaceae bacterium]|jgi:high-affinity iron transporter|nr:FTR1 family protein [Vallitaleaceae bacterium]
MFDILPGTIMGFREGLEASLIIVIILQYLKKSNQKSFQKYVLSGAGIGVFLSLCIGAVVYIVSKSIDQLEETSGIWESISSLIALILVTTFIIWMMKHGRTMVSDVHEKVKSNLSPIGVFSIALLMVIREGVEIATFTFAGKYTLGSIMIGTGLALIFSVLVYYSLIKVNLKLIFSITLGYLILQAGFLLGYSVHEGLSSLKTLEILGENNILYTKLYDVSGTIFYHKEGLIGLPLYVLLGWYSKPEIIQFILQYGYSATMFIIWYKIIRKEAN